MSKFFESKSKLIHYAYAIIFVLVLVFGLYFMTNYAHIHIFYSYDSTTGAIQFLRDDSVQIGSNPYATNEYLYDFLEKTSVHSFGEVTYEKPYDEWGFTMVKLFKEDFGKSIYDFQMGMSGFNDLIMVYVICGLICVALFVVFSNHNRRVYYKSNLISGIILPLAMIVFSIIMITKAMDLAAELNENIDLYKVIAVMQDPNVDAQLKDSMKAGNISFEDILGYASDIDASVIYISMGAFALVSAYSLFMIVYAILRYKGSTKRRNEIIERAAQQND